MLRFGLLNSFRDISHFITTRSGSSEADNYSSFNMCDYTGDDPAHVSLCRNRMADILEIPVDNFVFPRQVHKSEVGIVKDNTFTGEYDAVLTDRPGICIGISTADCVPILLYCPVRKVVGAVHAGWRGTVMRIASKTIRIMREHYGCDPKDIVAGIGPSISPEAFEVGDEVALAFQQEGFRTVWRESGMKGKSYIDLWEANRQDLIDAGVSETSIEISGICTWSESERFFSARRLGIKSGRIASMIMLRR